MISNISIAVGSIATLTALVVALIRLAAYRFQKKSKEHELYKEVRELCGTDARNNHAQILSAISSICKNPLPPKDIEWFIFKSGAFKHISSYSSCINYVEIDFISNEFAVRSKRLIVNILLTLAIYAICGFCGLMLLVSPAIFSDNIILEYSICLPISIPLLFLAYFSFREYLIVLDSYGLIYLLKHPVFLSIEENLYD